MNLSDHLLDFFLQLQSRGMEEALFKDETVLGMLNGEAEFHQLRDALTEAVAGKEEKLILLALRAMAKQRALLLPQLVNASLVVTFPGAVRIPARHTAQVVREMIATAKTEIILAGYAITSDSALPNLLSDAAESIARVTVLCDVWKNNDGVSAARAVLKDWPRRAAKPRIYEFKGGKGAGLMHVKTLIVDGADMLVTSANFTWSGMNNNVEFGVRINGRIARSAREVFDEFLRTGKFVEIT